MLWRCRRCGHPFVRDTTNDSLCHRCRVSAVVFPPVAPDIERRAS